MARSSLIARSLLAGSCAAWALVACSPSSSSTASGPGAGDDAGVDAGTTRSDACVAQDTALQAALDGARKSPNALVAVKNEACGTSVYVSGDASTATATSLFRVGSVTKTFVSATILTLVKEGKVSLDDPLSKWVTGVANTDGVTVRMLMNHSSGVYNYTEVKEFFTDRKKKWTPREIVDLATANPPYFAPGKGWHYSNTNYVLLGMIAEQASGEKLGPLVRERAFAPAGLTHTFFDGEEPVVGTMARGFTGKTDVTDIADPSGPWAAGAIVSTGADLAEWISALYTSDRVLDAASRDLLTKDPVTAQGEQYGLGVELLSNLATGGDGPAMGHGGDIDGYHTLAYDFVDKRTMIVVMVNQDGADPAAILAGTTKALFGR